MQKKSGVEIKMQSIFEGIDTATGMLSVAFEYLPRDILLVTAAHLGRLPDLSKDLTDRWEDPTERTDLQANLQPFAINMAAKDTDERLRYIDWLISNISRPFGYWPWMAREAAAQLASFTHGAASVRCSFDDALHPALHVGLLAQKEPRSVALTFLCANQDTADLAALCAAVLEIDMSVEVGDPMNSGHDGQVDWELSCPPFGQAIDARSAHVPEQTLSWLGASTKGRLSSEALALANLLAQTPDAHALISLTDGALFRSVGVEHVIREELVATGRLKAVLSVPSGMAFKQTGIASNFLLLSPAAWPERTVRFMDLTDSTFSTQTSRGRYDAKPTPLWAEALSEPAEKSGYGRDVPLPEITAQGSVLTVDRYLQSNAAALLEAFLDDYDTRLLPDVVDLVRPVQLPKTAEGEYVVYEAAPSDTAQNGFVARPTKATAIDRGGLRKARNQQLQRGDVLLSIKGTIGRVALVPDDVPSRDIDAFWTAGQSMMILRPRGREIAPEVLYEYLSSDPVNQRLNALAGGTAIQSLSIKDLKNLKIPVPSKKQQDLVREDFAKRQEAFKALERQREEIVAMRQQSWPHDALAQFQERD